MRRILGMVGLVVATVIAGATMAWAADSGTLNVSRDGNYTSGGKYDFTYVKVSGSWHTRITGTFNVTEPNARLDAHVDGYSYGTIVKRTTKGSSSYDSQLWGDTTYARSLSMRVCYVGLLWADCTEKSVTR